MTLSKRSKEIVLHTGFWLFYVFLRVFFVQFYPLTFWERLAIDLIELPLKMGALYFLIYYLVPRYVMTRRYWIFLIWLSVSIVIVTVLRRVIDVGVIYPLFFPPEVLTKYGLTAWSVTFRNLVYVYPVVGMGTALFFVRMWYRNQRDNERLQREQLTSELHMLKAQIHPHFLFNTLNNLYALALVSSPQTPDIILKLSDLLSYMLYQCNDPLVPLDNEIRCIENYIGLERIRYGQRLDVVLEVSGLTTNMRIAPLLLIPFVENCFKHGASPELRQAWVSLHLLVDDGWLTMQLENSVPDPQSNPVEISSGIGIQNARRRLDLIYPDRYELRIRQTDTFLVYLKLKLDSNPVEASSLTEGAPHETHLSHRG